MAKRPITSQPHLLTAWLALGLSFGAPAAYASDPLPGDAIAPPANVNIALFYNYFTDAGAFGSADGGGTTSANTHISTDIVVARYIRTFNVEGLLSGVDVYDDYYGFVGSQRVGVGNIGPPPRAAPRVPATAPSRRKAASASLISASSPSPSTTPPPAHTCFSTPGSRRRSAASIRITR